MKSVQAPFLLLLCLVLLFSSAQAASKKTEEIQPPTVTSYTLEEGTVVVSGTRAIVDYDLIRYETEDCVGWFYQEDLEISHPIMQGETDTFYMKKNYAGNVLKDAGCLCIPTEALSDLSEQTLVFYGRSGGSGPLVCMTSMKKQEYYEAHPYFRILTENGDVQLDVFAYMEKSKLTLEELTPPEDEEGFESWLEKMLEASLIDPLESNLPEAGDRIAILLNEATTPRRVMLAVIRPIRYETEGEVNLFKYAMDRIEGTSGVVDAGELGQRYVYFQTDPIWSDLRFESFITSKYRHVSGGACGPTALANILVNMLDPSELVKIKDYTNQDILFCTCSVNELYCNHNHMPYKIETPEEFVRYLPIVLCNFCTGNNVYGVISRSKNGTGTTASYVPYLCEALNLKCVTPSTLAEGLKMIEESGNRGALLVCATEFSPYSRVGSHFLAITDVVDGMAYVADSLVKTSYKSKGSVVKMVTSGVAGFSKFPVESASLSALGVVYYIEPNEGVKLCDHTYPEWEYAQ